MKLSSNNFSKFPSISKEREDTHTQNRNQRGLIELLSKLNSSSATNISSPGLLDNYLNPLFVVVFLLIIFWSMYLDVSPCFFFYITELFVSLTLMIGCGDFNLPSTSSIERCIDTFFFVFKLGITLICLKRTSHQAAAISMTSLLFLSRN